MVEDSRRLINPLTLECVTEGSSVSCCLTEGVNLLQLLVKHLVISGVIYST